MTIEYLILLILFAWIIPLLSFVFFFVTDPVPGTHHKRRLIDLRTLKPVSKILLGQKLSLSAVVIFIGIVRFTGGFPGREWVAAALYACLVGFAIAALVDLRMLQLPQERRIRDLPDRKFHR